MRTTFGPSVDAGTFDPHAPGSREYIAVDAGELELTLDGAAHLLRANDAIYYAGDCRHRFRCGRTRERHRPRWRRLVDSH
jgi:quercetin dioxygenase-like cupin family protein